MPSISSGVGEPRAPQDGWPSVGDQAKADKRGPPGRLSSNFRIPTQSSPSRQAGRVALRDPKQAQVVTSIIEFHTGSLPKLVESVPDTPAYSLARCPDVLQPVEKGLAPRLG
jgi:hypothetical protein